MGHFTCECFGHFFVTTDNHTHTVSVCQRCGYIEWRNRCSKLSESVQCKERPTESHDDASEKLPHMVH